jgi:hypothetical protein
MQVQVTIIVSSPPEETDLESLRSAASELTNKPDSITVEVTEADGRFSLVTCFAMKTAAQYKVVDKVAHKFKFWTWNLDGYQDMMISFA